ncbi:OmpA family protein [Diaphorobacter sp. MNS-0]|uniref:OmpA family protein n=1 Tax=Diaphorobacter sp. MNS-0 TaxID=2866628 RepID=UPI001C732602|nr:OmpA family protein [Diaphorobacter sp. MNS-0]QYY27511.1 OmpA family protein [Diaphorobacter sp. MNS-0]
MKKTPVTLALATAIALGLPGCAMFKGTDQNGAATATASDKAAGASRFRFNYDVSNRAGVGVLRAFDDRTSTIIQFVDLERQNPAIYDSKGKTLPYNRMGQYAIVSGLHPWLAVTVLGEQAIVTNNGYDAADPAAQVSALRASETESAAKLAATEAELERAKKELAQVQAQLAQRDADTEAINRQLDVIETRINGLAAKLVRVPFGFDSTAFKPSALMSAWLIPAAQKAQQVNIIGHTDAIGTTTANQKIATGRALAARAYLVQNGVPANKIRVSGKASGDFIADNTTEAGRAKNRRVDIELIGHGSTSTVAVK